MNQVKNFNSSPYFDDFDASKNFYRILFRPGYSVQTRELNQLQTILQQQISYISDYSVVDKTAVVGGNVNFNNKVNFIKLKAGTTLAKSSGSYTNAKIEALNGVKGNIQFVLDEAPSHPATIYVDYTAASPDTGAHLPLQNTQLTIIFEDGNREVAQIENSESATGVGSMVTLDDSIFYINKMFINVQKQALLLKKYNDDIIPPKFHVGILIKEEIVTADADESLYDNALGSPNETAPGADRYKVSAILINRDDVPEELKENFIELIRLDKGEVAVKPKEENAIIPLLQQVLARRTYDESGDYVVDTFDLDIREHLLKTAESGAKLNNGVYTELQGGDNSLLVAQLDPGVAYIRGYEVRINELTKLPFQKARDTATVTNNIIQLNYSNFITVKALTGDVVIGSKINFLNTGGANIGSAIVSGCEYITSTELKLYLINIISTNAFSEIKKIAADVTVSSMVAFTATFINYNIDNIYSSLVYPLPNGYSKSVDPSLITFYKTYTTVSNSGIININNEDGSEILSLAPDDYYVYVQNVGSSKPSSVTSVTNSSVRLDITNISPGTGQKNVKVIAKITTNLPKLKTKTLVGGNEDYSEMINASLLINNRIKLAKADGVKLLKVINKDGMDITSKFTFDGGARDSHYGNASINLKNGQLISELDVLQIFYSYYNHSITGDFFAADSYINTTYDNIPSYTDSIGNTEFLGASIDFRKVLINGSLEQNSRGHVAFNEKVISNVTYYLPRKDRIMVTSAGNLVHVKGIPDFNPKLPEPLADAITLYNLHVLPYTFNINDVISEKLNHKRYTMKDIGKLENRLTVVEEMTLLNKLEVDTASINFGDRFKTGYIVDNFSTSNTGDLNDANFGVAYDILNPSIRPNVISDFIDLKFDPTKSTNFKHHEEVGIITLDYTVEEFIKQELASDIVKIQPYINYGWGTGAIQLTPSSDIWKEDYTYTENLYTSTTNRLDDIIIQTVINKI